MTGTADELYGGSNFDLTDYDMRHGGTRFSKKYDSNKGSNMLEEYPKIKFRAYNSFGEEFAEKTFEIRHEYPFMEITGKATFLGRLEGGLNTDNAGEDIAKMTNLDEKGALYFLIDKADRSEENFGFKATLDADKKYHVENIGKDVLRFIQLKS